MGLETRLSRRRWPMMFLFVLFSAFNAFQWVEFTIVPAIFMEYYGVSVRISNPL